MMKFVRGLTAIITTTLLISLTLLSCRKENKETDYNDNIIAAQASVKGEVVFTDVFNMIYKASINEDLYLQGTAVIDTAIVTFDSIPQLKIRVDYGQYFRLCPDGLVRKGSYSAIFTDMPYKPGSSATLTFNGYISQDLIPEGNPVFVFSGENASGYPVFQYSVSNGMVTQLHDSINTSTFSWKCLNDFTLIDGKQTPHSAEDDIFTITGTSSGVAVNGKAFQTEVITSDPLIDALACNWIVSGTQQITTPALEITSGTIDYITEDACNYKIAFYFDHNVFYFRMD